jgi:REP element-mobilizing transposase RayT
MHADRGWEPPGFSYTGPHRYSLTVRAYEQQPLFDNRELAGCVRTQILRAASSSGYAVVVYCIMPTHVHILVEGRGGRSPLPEFVKGAKRHAGFYGRKIIGAPVWQTGYLARVLREAEDTRTVVAYILDNPVRRRLAANPRDYLLSGSGVCERAELMALVHDRDRWITPYAPDLEGRAYSIPV